MTVASIHKAMSTPCSAWKEAARKGTEQSRGSGRISEQPSGAAARSRWPCHDTITTPVWNTKASRWQHNTPSCWGLSTRRKPEKHVIDTHYCLYKSSNSKKQNPVFRQYTKKVCNILASAGVIVNSKREIHYRLRCVCSDCKRSASWFCSAQQG